MTNSLIALCSGFLLILAGCTEAGDSDHGTVPDRSDANVVAVIGAIHGQHRRSERYSLQVLKEAIVRFDPEIVMVELPPDRLEIAVRNYKQLGAVRESRTDDFPELTDVVFPLQQELGFEMVPVAAWTQEIADERRQILREIEKDPARAAEWEDYQAAVRTCGKAVSGKSDDPQFVHSRKYDDAVRKRQETYDRLFGKELGAGGWEAINRAHFSLVEAALDDLDGQQKRILILYGAWHKYWFLDALDTRSGIALIEAAPLFAD
ncbi:MAG: hypothetical protein AAGM33_02255 [Pseudomonadota bacterium]